MSAIDKLFDRIRDNREPETTAQSIAQTTAALIAPFYGVGAALNRLSHDIALRRRQRLEAVTLSVGNITLGGTGKSTFIFWLANELEALGRRTAILTRGYGRKDESRLVVAHDGRRLRATTEEAGDEPVMLAQQLQRVPILVCADRVRAGELAIRKLAVDTLLLDDGFQHHALARDGDLVLFDATTPPSELELFPRGTLREPLRTLQRAHLLVITRWSQATQPKRVFRELQRLAPSVPIVRTQMVIGVIERLSNRESIPLESLAGRRVVALCGIGNPLSFRRSIEGIGLVYTGMKKLPDHGRLDKAQILALDAIRRRKNCEFLVVTEKDAVKLRELGNLPPEILVLQQRLSFLTPRDEKKALQVIKARLEARQTRGYLGAS